MKSIENMFSDVASIVEKAASGVADESDIESYLHTLKTFRAEIANRGSHIEMLISVLEQAKTCLERMKNAKSGIDDAVQMNALREEFSLMAKDKRLMGGISNLQTQLESFRKNEAEELHDERESAKLARLNELYDRLESCQDKGDAAGAKVVRGQIAGIIADEKDGAEEGE